MRRVPEATGSLVLERSDYVLWSIAPQGIVLHELRGHRYMELDRAGYLLWGLLDGARSVDEVVALGLIKTPGSADTEIRRTIKTLLAHDFIEPRKP